MFKNLALSITRGIVYTILAFLLGSLMYWAHDLLHLAPEATFSTGQITGTMISLVVFASGLTERNIFRKLWQKDSGPHWLISFGITGAVMGTLFYLFWPYLPKTQIRGNISLWYVAGMLIGTVTTSLVLELIADQLRRRTEKKKLLG